MSQTDIETPDRKAPETQNSEGSDLFSEVLFSGKEIEGLFEKKRREEMLSNSGKKSGKKRGANGVKDPLTILKERVAIYNRKLEDEFHLVLVEEDLSYQGLLKFKYHNGYQKTSENFRITNSDTASAIIPTLIKRFFPHCDAVSEISGSYILLSQGGSERELEATEKPLEIALDCSTKGLSPPSFAFKPTPSLLVHSTSPRKQIENKLSTLSLQTGSLSSLGHASSDSSESPKVQSPYVTYGEDHESLYSFSSNGSNPSSFSNQHTGSRSPRSLFKPRSQAKPGQKLTFENSYHKMSEPVVSSQVQSQNLTPELSRKTGKSKSRVGNFMEGVARTLKSKKKMRPTSIYPEGGLNDMPDPRKSALVSPSLADRKLLMPTVFHIYYSKAQSMQLYKSVLVSVSSTARDVIKQSLERYGMKFVSPDNFLLFEVIGKWEEVTETTESDLGKSLQVDTSADGGSSNSKQQLLKPARAFEEFVECYTRKLDYDERPYDVQFFHEPPNGYTRRFELRSKASEEGHSPDDNQKIQSEFLPTTPVFGTTSHTRNRSARERTKSADTFDFSVETEEEQDSSTLDHSFVDCSSPDGSATTQNTHELYPAVTSGVFLLNLQLVPSEKEFLVYRILYEKFVLKNTSTGHSRVQSRRRSNSFTSQSEAYVSIPERDWGSPLFTITRSQQQMFLIEPKCPMISINGKSIDEAHKLHHGDLIKVDNSHLFMFQNHSFGGVATAHWPYLWKPSTKRSLHIPIDIPSSSHNGSVTVPGTANIEEVQQPISSQAQVIHVSTDSEASFHPTVNEVDYGVEEELVEAARRKRSNSDTRILQKHVSRKSKKGPQRELLSPVSGQLSRDSKKLGTFPADRKLMFSYDMEEEDTLLQILVDDLDPSQVVFSLAPAYVLCMCMEYSMRCSGPRAASRLACKAVERIQKSVSRVTSEITSWKPVISQSNSYPSLDEIHAPIHSILFWLVNSMELYNFLLTQDVLDLSVLVHGEHGEEHQEENVMTLLENMMQHLFQQAFYPVSKGLYVILPKMLEEGYVSNSCVHHAVKFLKGILEMMFELHIHTEMIAQFFANIFFFLNGAMFNAFIDQGPHLELFQFQNGTKLRAKLDILENWAGREGFRDGPLQFLAVFSSAVDLVSTPPEELLQLSWSVLREEFPALLPSQLHFILANYLLPEDVEDVPIQWMPTPEEGRSATDNDSLHESFESHPQFEVPIGGYLLDLDSQSCDNHMLHEFVDSLRKELKRREKSVDIVRIKKEESNIVFPTMIYSTNTYPPSPICKKKKPLLNIDEIVTSDLKTSKKANSKKQHQQVKGQTSAELRGRVKSIVEPHFRAPEKLVILYEKQGEQEFIEEEAEEEDNRVKIYEVGGMDSPLDDFPKGSRVLSLQRGNRGFGFNAESRKDPVTGDNNLYVSSLVEDGGIAEITDIAVGDQILAVDDLKLETSSHSEVQQYIKDAEEEVTLIVCSPSSS